MRALRLIRARLTDAAKLNSEDSKGFLSAAAVRLAEKGATKDPIIKRLRRMVRSELRNSKKKT